jgi:glycosyltransferase involved in cell wall biosynthesis
MVDTSHDVPWVSFCMSTFKRPAFLAKQLECISRQEYKNFEVIISDNDPERSGEVVVNGFNDPRFKYYANALNLGMVKSFNKSIERATTPYIVMITDDDPVDENFLSEMHKLYAQDDARSVYAGFKRSNKPPGATETISKDDFVFEILDVNKTPAMLWSSCVMCKAHVELVGRMPDYGSPHFADQALVAMTGGVNGGMVKNRMFSSLSAHENNFSKSNFNLYKIGVVGFKQLMEEFSAGRVNGDKERRAVNIHLGKWFFGCVFTLKKHFFVRKDFKMKRSIEEVAVDILELPYMQRFKPKFYAKTIIFAAKKYLFRVEA